MAVDSPCVGTSCCFKTTVKNIAGSAKTFAFLPGHGVQTLEADEEKSYDGDILQNLLTHKGNKRLYDAFISALKTDKIQILHMPNPIIFDHTLNEPKMVQVTNEEVVIGDPCWSSTVDSM